jgi:hypothetical protein
MVFFFDDAPPTTELTRRAEHGAVNRRYFRLASVVNVMWVKPTKRAADMMLMTD